jgi:hypothetical protein
MRTNYVMLIDDRPGQPNGPPNLPGSVPRAMGAVSPVIVIEIADSDIHGMEPRDVRVVGAAHPVFRLRCRRD